MKWTKFFCKHKIWEVQVLFILLKTIHQSLTPKNQNDIFCATWSILAQLFPLKRSVSVFIGCKKHFSETGI